MSQEQIQAQVMRAQGLAYLRSKKIMGLSKSSI